MLVLLMPENLGLFTIDQCRIFMLEPYAVKAARTVLRGGKLEKAYLSQLGQRVYLDGELNPFFRVSAVNSNIKSMFLVICIRPETK